MLAEQFWALRFRIALQERECAGRRNAGRRISQLDGALGFDFGVGDGGQIMLRLGRAAVVIVVPCQARSARLRR